MTLVLCYRFNRASSGLGGLSFEEGTFSVFGYLVEGQELLTQIRPGDVITKVEILSGENKLVVPERAE